MRRSRVGKVRPWPIDREQGGINSLASGYGGEHTCFQLHYHGYSWLRLRLPPGHSALERPIGYSPVTWWWQPGSW